jgi:uncharacterized membrane protein
MKRNLETAIWVAISLIPLIAYLTLAYLGSRLV